MVKKSFIMVFISCIMLCGCIEMETKTSIKKDGKCFESISIKASLIPPGEEDSSMMTTIKENGYEVSMSTKGTETCFTASKTHDSVKAMYSGKHFDSVSGELVDGNKNVDYSDFNLFFFRKIVLKEHLLPDTQQSGMSEKNLLGKIARSSMNMKRVIEMPFPISSSNADFINKKTNTATWSINESMISNGYIIEISSTYVNYPAVSVLIVLLIVVSTLASSAAKSAKRRSINISS